MLRTRSQKSDAREFFAIDPELLRAIVDDAPAFLDDFIPKQREAEELAQQPNDDRILLPGDGDWVR